MVIRPAIPADAFAVARIHVRAWQAGYRGLLPAEYLDTLRAEDRAARYTFGIAGGPATFVPTDADTIVGFMTIKDDELAALHVEPDAWRRRVGTALLLHARTAFAEAGLNRAWLHVLAGNARARSFYERDGWN